MKMQHEKGKVLFYTIRAQQFHRSVVIASVHSIYE